MSCLKDILAAFLRRPNVRLVLESEGDDVVRVSAEWDGREFCSGCVLPNDDLETVLLHVAGEALSASADFDAAQG